MNIRLIYISAVAVSLMLGTAASTAADTLPQVFVPNAKIHALSDNAQYAVSANDIDDSSGSMHGTGGTLYRLSDHASYEISAASGWVEIRDVTDDGRVVGSVSGKPAVWDYQTGQWRQYSVPTSWGGGHFTAVTPDGSMAVGYYYDRFDEYVVTPMAYNLDTGESLTLSNLPTVDLDGQNQHQNVFYAISPDGRYAMGKMSEGYMMPVSMFVYIYDLQENTWKPIGYDYNPQTRRYTSRVPDLHFVYTQFMSCDGQWVTGTAYMVHDGGELGGGTEGFYPYRYNVATDQMEVYYTSADANVAGNKVTGDGVVLGSAPIGNPYPTAMVRSGRFFVSLDQIFEQVYGRTTRSLTGDDVTGAFEALSADGLTAVMITYERSYVLTMPEPFEQAARRVNLLSNYSASIPDGSLISKVNEIQLTFDRQVECLSYPQNIKLVDSKGNTVRSASGFALSHTSDNTVVLTFRTTTLTPGERYTIDIPAEMIWLKDDASYKNAPITLHYVGRGNEPVQLQSAVPATGSAVTQINANPDNITLTFDCPIAVQQDGVATLYNADDGATITTLAMAGNGSQVILFPTAEYHLYKGTNYRVVIDAGAITDLSGSGPCEQIALDYRGAYVRQLTDDDLYIFKSTCDNYDDFMMWMGQFNEPSAVPVSWGFAADTPWVLIRDNEETTNMALCTHSMFTTPGSADNWLVTPQLYIPDDKVYLTFDAQRYRRSKADVLRVIVYEDEASYNYLNLELAERFFDNGDMVLDQEVPAGATDEGLDGEWTHYTIDMAKYAGRNVYVGLLYQNYDESAIFIDNVFVMRDMNLTLTNQTPSVVVMADDVTVRGIVSISSEIASYDGVALELLDADGQSIDSIVDDTVTLRAGDTYEFAFARPLPLTPGYESDYSIVVRAGDGQTPFRYSVQDLTYEPVKRVVLEEFTGSTCPNCPLGIVAIENLQRLYPQNFIPLTLRTYGSDMYSAGAVDYTSFLGMNAAPSGRVNRGEILAPMLSNGSAGYVFYGRGITMDNGFEAYLWGDAVQDELNVPAIVDVAFTVDYNPATGAIDVPCDVTFALNQSDRNVGVFAVVIESNLPTFQQNNVYMTSDTNLGEWGAGGAYAQPTVTTWQASDVVRYVVTEGAYNGQVMTVQDFAAGQAYQTSVSGVIPADRLQNPANCHVVVMLIDRSSGRVLNANIGPLTTSGIGSVSTDDIPAVYYDLQGIPVTNPVPGAVYIRVQGDKVTKVRG